MPTPALPHSTGLQFRPFRAVRYDPVQAGDLSHMICRRRPPLTTFWWTVPDRCPTCRAPYAMYTTPIRL